MYAILVRTSYSEFLALPASASAYLGALQQMLAPLSCRFSSYFGTTGQGLFGSAQLVPRKTMQLSTMLKISAFSVKGLLEFFYVIPQQKFSAPKNKQ